MESIAFYVPSQIGTFELVEKKSRFLGEIWHISSEEEAKQRIEETKKKYHDARHHAWCYKLDDTVIRYTDDGEPQGTAGQAMLSCFQQENIQEFCCVVTRYYGGIQLGPGGLKRAYSHTGKGALDAAGRSYYQQFQELQVKTPYHLLETVQKLVETWEAVLVQGDYGVDVLLEVRVLQEKTREFLADLQEKTAGKVIGELGGNVAELVSYHES